MMRSVSASPELVSRLRAAGCVFAEEEAALLAEAAGGAAELEALVVRREAGEPVEQLAGWVEFCGLRLVVAPGVFVPRQRTALLVVFSPSLFILVRLVATAIDLAVEPFVVRVLGRRADAVGRQRPV